MDVGLDVNESVTVEIDARPRWNHTGVQLAEGGRYRLIAEGTWYDSGMAAGPDGYASPNFCCGQPNG